MQSIRSWRFAVVVLCVCVGAAVPTSAAVPERSTTESLALKRYVAAGDRAYVIGSQDGAFPPIGWHIRGEMGGVWTHPIKLLDGYWLSLDGSWLPPAERFTSAPGSVRLDFPQTAGVEPTLTQFAPDGRQVVLIGLTLRNPGAQARQLPLALESRSELMAAYPWGSTKPSAKELNGADVGSYDGGRLIFREPDDPWFAAVGAAAAPDAGEVGDGFWGSVPPAQRPEHSEHGNGTGGRLSWNVTVPAGGTVTHWIGVAGSQRSQAEAEATLAGALAEPERLLEAKRAERLELLGRTRVRLPDPALQAAFDWGKLNLADMRIAVEDARIRDVDEGRAYPDPVTTIPRLSGIGAGFPDYPWLFGTDGAYTAHPLIASGQWEVAREYLRSIRDVSRVVNGASGKVVHEIVSDGSVYFGANDDAGNTNETAQFASAVALLWRWSGDDGLRDEMYDFVVDGLRTVTSTLDADGDRWPEGNGMVERPGMGSEKLDVTAYTWQALRALAEMAAAKGDGATARWARAQAAAIERRFDARWRNDADGLYADSLCNPGDEGDPGTNVCSTPDQPLQQRHWINATPMEVGLAPAEHAHRALGRLESPDFSGGCGLFHTGVGGGPDGKGEQRCWTLGSAVMAVGEANYGRLGAGQATRYTERIAAQLDLEQPGALPELIPSPGEDPFVDFRDRAMFMQAWSSYGTQWPVIARFLGVEPDVPDGTLSVVADVPDGWPGLSVRDLRVGSGVLAAGASRDGTRYVTRVAAPRGLALTIGHVLPTDARPRSVRLDGRKVRYRLVRTPRGRELLVRAHGHGSHELVVRSQ